MADDVFGRVDITKEEFDLAIEKWREKIKFGIEMELHDSIRFAIRDGHCYATVLASFDDEDGETVLLWEIDKGTSGDCIFEIITAPFSLVPDNVFEIRNLLQVFRTSVHNLHQRPEYQSWENFDCDDDISIYGCIPRIYYGMPEFWDPRLLRSGGSCTSSSGTKSMQYCFNASEADIDATQTLAGHLLENTADNNVDVCKSPETHILCSRTCKNPNEHCVTYSNLTLPKNFGAFVTKVSPSKHEGEWKGIVPLQLDLRPVSGLSVSVLHDEFCKHDVVKDWICGSSGNDVENDVPCKEFNGMYFPPSKAASQIQAYEEIEMRTGCGIGYVDGVPQSPPHDSGKITPFKAEGFSFPSDEY